LVKITREINGSIFFLILVLFSFSCKSEVKSGLPTTRLTIDGNNIAAEVANTESTRMAGLMFRRDLGVDNGMLFVFPDAKLRAFWMKNTLIPLSIAFINDKGVIVNELEMPPQTEQTFMSDGPAQYALEMNAGWFTKRGIKPGDMVLGATTAPSAKE
jgi:uncharacterized membrane protein (UPF0127 family)